MQRKPAENLKLCHTFKVGYCLSPDTVRICFRAGENLKELETERPRHGNTSSATGPLQLMEWSAKNTPERGGESNGVESGQMPMRVDL